MASIRSNIMDDIDELRIGYCKEMKYEASLMTDIVDQNVDALSKCHFEPERFFAVLEDMLSNIPPFSDEDKSALEDIKAVVAKHKAVELAK